MLKAFLNRNIAKSTLPLIGAQVNLKQIFFIFNLQAFS